ncbi:hypothetical protein SAMN05518801_107108 [Novosphingobium sp. CF614]|nr:hypothetical protein SAMN05518801_107108 [Novosphingobium sp. CF614]
MCLNQIFKDEQLALMQYSGAANAHEIASCQRELGHLLASFRSYPYPHRPYAWRSGHEAIAAVGADRSVAKPPHAGAEGGAF